jgi:hypothetical protein
MERITATLPDEHVALLRGLAGEHHTSVASVLRAAIEVMADDTDVASIVRRHIRPDARGGARHGAGRPRRTWLTAREAARAIRRELDAGDEVFALRILARLIADLRTLERPGDTGRCLAPPATTGRRRWDTLLGAAVGRECRHKDLDAPAWTDPPPLAQWWFPVLADPILTARTMQRTPVDFAARGIWLDAGALETL